MDMKQSLGLRIRAFRQTRRMTQEQVAEAIERTPEAVSNIERGQSLPSLDTLERLARALEVPLADFFENAGSHATRQRIEQEARFRMLTKSMSDEELEISLGQAEVLLRVRSKEAKRSTGL